jgi:pimeloyl-ACP methyl ester carboxylesterase
MLPSMTAEMFEGTPPLVDYRETSPHPEKFPDLVKKLVTLDQTPFDWREQLPTISAETLLVFGDADVVTPEHQVVMFRALGGGVNGDMVPAMPKAQLAVMPGTTHLDVGFNPALLHGLVETFLATDAKAPFAPQ